MSSAKFGAKPASGNDFGNATDSQVLVGSTFSSENGLQQTGVYDPAAEMDARLQPLKADLTKIKEAIGQPADTGGTTTNGAVMAKLNAALGFISKFGIDGNGLYVNTD